MSQIKQTHPKWNRYRELIDETTELEYEIIGILSEALCRKDGDGQPNDEERSKIKMMKNSLNLKLEELKTMKEEVEEFIKVERSSDLRRYK
jgi:hypothetical protein